MSRVVGLFFKHDYFVGCSISFLLFPNDRGELYKSSDGKSIEGELGMSGFTILNFIEENPPV